MIIRSFPTAAISFLRRKFSLLTLAGLCALAPQNAAAGFWFWDDDDPETRSSVRVRNDMSPSDALDLAEVTLGEAVATAVAQVEGKAIWSALIEDDGYLFYRVAVVAPENGVSEVLVDPKSGAVLAVGSADDDDDGDDDGDDDEGSDGEDEDDEDDDDREEDDD